MVLVDTSVWVDHFRHGDGRLERLLESGQVCCHPFIIEELACGHLRNRQEILSLLEALPSCRVAAHAEVLHIIEYHRLSGAGIGAIDAHLLASARLSGVRFWSRDKRVLAAVNALNLVFVPG